MIIKSNSLSKPKNTPHQGLFFLLRVILFCFFVNTSSHAYETGQRSYVGSYKINLSSDVKDALDNGITLTFDCELKTEKKIWLFALPQNKIKHNFTLNYHSLSNRYLVRYFGAQAPKNFASSGEATEFISEQSVKFLNQYASKQSGAKMRLSLNKFKLLGPMRLNAFIAKQWNIDTGWILWSPEI